MLCGNGTRLHPRHPPGRGAGGSCLRPGRRQNDETRLRGVGGGSRAGRPGAAPPFGASPGTPQAPRGFPASPEARSAARARAHGPDDGRRAGRQPRPAWPRGPAARHASDAAPRRGGATGSEGEKGRPGPPDSPRARPPPTRGGRATPRGVFKPPRRDALGTWRRRSEARAVERRGTRPTASASAPGPGRRSLGAAGP